MDWPHKRERRGHDPAKSVKADVTCAVGKVCTNTLLMAVCNTSNTKRKTRREGINTSCCWNKFSEFGVAGIVGFCATKRRVPGDPGRQQEEKCGKYLSSSVRPDRFPSLFGSESVIFTFRFSLGRDRSCPIATASRNNLSSCIFILLNPSRSFRSSTHQDVLDRFTLALCVCPQLCNAQGAVCGADCGAAAAAAAFQKSFFFFLL